MPMATNNTEGSSWEMGVAIPIHNWSMRHPSKIQTTLGLAYTSGVTLSCTGNGSDGWQYPKTLLRYYLRVGDIVTIGPSTNTTSPNPGQTETVHVTGVSDTDVITIDSVLTYDYNAGDPVSAIGTNIPGGWHAYGTSGDFGTGKELTTFKGHNTSGNGFDDHSFSLHFTTVSGTGSIDVYTGVGPDYTKVGIVPRGALDRLERGSTNTTYFISLHYKVLGAGTGAHPTLYLFDSNANPLTTNPVTFLNDNPTDWLEKTSFGAKGSSVSAFSYIKFDIPGSMNQTFGMLIDCVVVCHAKGTDDASAGIYTLDDDPMAGSVRYAMRNKVVKGDILAGPGVFSHLGGADNKWVVRARFQNASQALWDNLMVLMRWQRQGYPLLLKPYISALPPYLQGEMRLTRASKDHWDLGKRTINFEFTEM